MPLSLVSVERVEDWPGKPTVWTIRCRTVEEQPWLMKFRTLKAWEASLCDRARETAQYVWVVWKDGRGSARDVVKVSLDETQFRYEDGRYV